MTKITIGNGITSIGNDAFTACISLTEVTIKDLSSWCKIKFASKGSNPLCGGTKLHLDEKEITQLTIPEDISFINEFAFYQCGSINSVTIDNDVTSIGSEAFTNCGALTELTIGNSVTSIGNDAFKNCNALTKITIGDGVTSIGKSAFSGCKALTKVTIPSGIKTINAFTFYGCNALAEVTIGEGVTSIEKDAFKGCRIKMLYCYATNPPSIIDSFLYSDINEAILYVPARCGVTYRDSDWGTYFENIIEMD